MQELNILLIIAPFALLPQLQNAAQNRLHKSVIKLKLKFPWDPSSKMNPIQILPKLSL